MDLSKALDTLNRNLLFAKLKDYDFLLSLFPTYIAI